MSSNKPSFSGGYRPAGPPKKSMDNVGEEKTRKIAGGGAGISFAPMTAPIGPLSSPFNDTSSIQTIQMKAAMAGTRTAAVPSPSASKMFRWKLDSVPTLPEFHPLERTAVFVEYSEPAEVAARISKVLRELSIEASYDNEKARVRCTSPEGVDFRVRLYRGRGSYNHGIIVEVQRRFGMSICFQDDTKTILDAAQGFDMPPPPPPGLGRNSLPMVSDPEDDYVPPPSGASSLKMISKMLSHTGFDSHYLALQTLTSLTDSTKMGASTARAVAMEVLREGNDVGAKVFSILVKKSVKEEDDVFKLQSMALTILGNVLQVTKGAISAEIYEDRLRAVLLDKLDQARENPRAAQLAARCLEYVIQIDPDVDEMEVELKGANSVGHEIHVGLMNQTQVCLNKLS